MVRPTPPKAPTDTHRLASFQTLTLLQLIRPFRPWLRYTRDSIPRRFDSPLIHLFDCFACGAPLCTLLELLGSPTPRHLQVSPEDFNFDLGMNDRRVFIENVIARVGALEAQGRLGYGEVVRPEDFLGGSLTGYMKVLNTVKRLLKALQDSYPGLFAVSQSAVARRSSLLQQLLGGERVHVSRLVDVADAASRLMEQEGNATEPPLEALVVTCSKLIPYHNLVLQALSNAVSSGNEQWDEIFSFTSKPFKTSIFSSYRALCANYLSLKAHLEEFLHKNRNQEEAHILLQHLSPLLARISEYHTVLHSILSVTPPSPSVASPASSSESFCLPSFDSLCLTTFEMSQLSDTITEVGCELRTMWANRELPGRLGALKSLSMEGLGALVLDDMLVVEPISGARQTVFLFQTMILCCRERPSKIRGGVKEANGEKSTRYPVKGWELGAGLEARSTLSLVCAIPITNVLSLHLIDEAYFELNYLEPTYGAERILAFYPTTPPQFTQWISTLELLVPRVIRSSSIPSQDAFDSHPFHPGNISLIQTCDDRLHPHPFSQDVHRSTARPWSLIGRKGTHSESSSVVEMKREEREGLRAERASVLTPSLLPGFFGASRKQKAGSINGSLNRSVNGHGSKGMRKGGRGRRTHSRHRSAKSPLSSGFTREDILYLDANPSVSGGDFLSPSLHAALSAGEGLNGSRVRIPDLTGKVFREGTYPVAHGGHSDVWRAVWRKDDGVEVGVAVKVLRKRSGDGDREAKLLNDLRHELEVWKQLIHPHVLPLLGTVSDFGPYTSMICPWMENGSISKYLERCGDILSTEDRLRIITEVAEGLTYLHLCSIIHGDLTGTNILINSDLRAQLCDFGLSTLVMQSNQAHTPESFTNGLGGAVRWADAALFAGMHGGSLVASPTGGEDEEGDQVWRPPPVTFKSDVYSFGSVMLEILSGRQPYHYLATDAQVVIELHKGNRPRRPARSFVDDEQWEIIQWCWTQPPEERPDLRDVVDRVFEMVDARVGDREPSN